MDKNGDNLNLDNDSILFLQWLQARYDQIDKKLEPYWKRYESRLNSGGNLYGVATYGEEGLLKELEYIYSLIKQLKDGKPVEQLANELLERNSNDKGYCGELGIFKEYLETFSPPQRKRR